jgi:hypothetical protein
MNRLPDGHLFLIVEDGTSIMLNAELTNLRKDFDAAITSNRNVVTLDPSIADLRAKISQTDFVESCYSRSQLRKMNDWLGRISNARLKADPMAVAIAVGAVRQLLDDLELTMRQSEESKWRIEAAKHS